MREPMTTSPYLSRPASRNPGTFGMRGPIMIVDDNPDEANLAKRAFERLNPQFPITVLGSGRELVAHLQGLAGPSIPDAALVPSVILLDLGMPEMDGFAIMDWLTKQPRLASIPVIVLTNFDDLQHLKRAYSSGVRAYLLKPIKEDALSGALSSLSISI